MALRFAAFLDDHHFSTTLLRMRTAANNTASAMRRDFETLTNILPGGGFLARLGPGGAGVGAAAAALGGIAAAGDKAANSLARINAATGDLDKAEEVFGTLRQLAGETGVAVSDAAGQFTRFSIAGRQIGATNEEVIKLIGLMQKAGVVGGSSAVEISSAGMQLGQALASGRFQGDELRSIMENMPLLAEQLAKNLGVSVGQLREMGKEGQLTTDNVFPALLKSADAIEEKFAEMPMTMSRAFGSMTNEVLGFLADIDNAIGLSRLVAGTLEGLQGYAPGDRAEIAQANRLKANADAEMKWLSDRMYAERTERRTGYLNKDPAPYPGRQHEQDEKDTKEVLKKQAAEAEKNTKEEERNAERIREAYAQMYVDRLARQEELRQKASDAAEESVRNAERESLAKMHEGWQEVHGNALADLAQAEDQKAQIDKLDPNDRRQAIRDMREQEWKDKQNERIKKGGKDARFGADEMEKKIGEKKVIAEFTEAQMKSFGDAVKAAVKELITI